VVGGGPPQAVQSEKRIKQYQIKTKKMEAMVANLKTKMKQDTQALRKLKAELNGVKHDASVKDYTAAAYQEEIDELQKKLAAFQFGDPDPEPNSAKLPERAAKSTADAKTKPEREPEELEPEPETEADTEAESEPTTQP
jgi:hypothetical protein